MSVEINGEYFSGSQVSLYIGDIWVDDIDRIDYTESANKTPIYGYGSEYYDFLAKGTHIVQGSFDINFREPNYLWLIIEIYKSRNTLNLGKNKSSDPNKNSETFSDDNRTNLSKALKYTNPKAFKENQIKKFDNTLKGTSVQSDENFFNHIPFNIKIGYGYNADSAVKETIQDVEIIGKGKTINVSGVPVHETYSFIARKIK